MKRTIKALATGAAITLLHLFASAQAWPDKPVRLVVPYAPGGTTDFSARMIAEKLSQQTGKSFFVENKSGGSGTIGTAQVAKSPPDGTTFLVNDTTYAMLPALFATVAPPGSTSIPVVVGSITLAVTAVAALAAWSARETYRLHMNDLGQPGAQPVERAEYLRLRAQKAANESRAFGSKAA